MTKCSGTNCKGQKCMRNIKKNQQRCLYHCIASQECSICHESIKESNMYQTLCNHQFHRKCIQKWLSHSNTTCPMCRFVLRKANTLLHYKVVQSNAIKAYINIQEKYMNDEIISQIIQFLETNGCIFDDARICPIEFILLESNA